MFLVLNKVFKCLFFRFNYTVIIQMLKITVYITCWITSVEFLEWNSYSG